MKKIKEERGSMAAYVAIVLLSFLFILSALYFTSITVRKTQLLTVLKVKESYELGNDKAEEIYESQLAKKYESDGLILHYDATNNTGFGHSENTKVWKDLSGNGNDGIIMGEATWQEDSLTLDAVDDYINIPVIKLNQMTQGTVIVVCKLNDWGEDSSTIFYKGSTIDENQSHIQIARNGDSTLAINTSIANGTDSTQDSAQITAYTSEKMHIAMTWDGTYLKNYKDGTQTRSVSTTILPSQESAMCYIGKGAENRYLNGQIYEVRVYNKALNEQEIQYIYEEITAKEENY